MFLGLQLIKVKFVQDNTHRAKITLTNYDRSFMLRNKLTSDNSFSFSKSELALHVNTAGN